MIKFSLQILFLLLTWFTNHTNTTYLYDFVSNYEELKSQTEKLVLKCSKYYREEFLNEALGNVERYEQAKLMTEVATIILPIAISKAGKLSKIDDLLLAIENNTLKFEETIRKVLRGVRRHPNWVEITDIARKVENLTPHVLKVETNASGAFIPKNVTKNGTIFNMEGFKGCHTENALKDYVQANGGTYVVKNKSVGVGGVYEGQPVIYLNNKEYVKINGTFVEYEAGKLGGTSSFFPENWSNEKIKEEVEFAIANNHGAVSVDKPTELFGFSKNGSVEILFYYNADGSIGSYFPKKR